MDESKNNQPIEEERKDSIKFAISCLVLIVIFVAVVSIGLLVMYLRSIMTGSKEFMVQ